MLGLERGSSRPVALADLDTQELEPLLLRTELFREHATSVEKLELQLMLS